MGRVRLPPPVRLAKPHLRLPPTTTVGARLRRVRRALRQRREGRAQRRRREQGRGREEQQRPVLRREQRQGQQRVQEPLPPPRRQRLQQLLLRLLRRGVAFREEEAGTLRRSGRTGAFLSFPQLKLHPSKHFFVLAGSDSRSTTPTSALTHMRTGSRRYRARRTSREL